MCGTCGCSGDSEPTVTEWRSEETSAASSAHAHEHGHDGNHGHGHRHEHEDHAGSPRRRGAIVDLQEEVLAGNNRLAERNRGWLAGRNILALNLVSSPGAGKTTLLERTVRELGSEIAMQVIEGDQASFSDARRIEAAGCRVVQINTGTGCHLDAAMVARGLKQLGPPPDSVVMIENVGNLVCPALFDLGERAKVLIVSVTEGEDKPIKYPHMFRASDVLILNKIDLLPHVSFDVERFLDSARQVNSRLRVFRTSATRGDGLAEWYGWVRGEAARRVELI